MKQFQFVAVWGISHEAGHYVVPGSHDKYELVYYRNGHGTSKVGNKEFTFYSNTFIIIPPGAQHDERHDTACDLLFIRFHCSEEIPTGLFEDAQGTVYKIVKAIQRETLDQRTSYKDMITLKFNELLILLDRYNRKNNEPKVQKNFEYIINFITENYNEKVLLKDLAEQLNYSYDYFQHQFKELTGYSPQQFLIFKRIEAAKTMLQNESLSCTDVAHRCGFSNSAQFSALFKRELGMTPQQYRKKKC